MEWLCYLGYFPGKKHHAADICQIHGGGCATLVISQLRSTTQQIFFKFMELLCYLGNFPAKNHAANTF
jgi:uncharacterized membrane protein YqaE (UPF0057 family)